MLSKNQIKEIQFLHHKKHRDLEKNFIAEGMKFCDELLKSHPVLIKRLYGTESFFSTRQQWLQQSAVPHTVVDDDTLKKISLLDTPNEALAVVHYFSEVPAAVDFSTQFTLYLDDIRDPGNMGTIIRLADWFGMPHIFASRGSCDIYNPKVIQASMGAAMRVRVHYRDLEQVIHAHGITRVFGALLNSPSIYQKSLAAGLIVIGNEGKGISASNLPLVNEPLSIPAAAGNGSESLNAAMATSIIVSEFFRQLRA
jgi:TrmH family RNA methyltransferase